MSTPGKTRVFISHARKDGAHLAQRIQCDLSAQGFNVYFGALGKAKAT
jgi:hypothetical protein